MRSRWRRISEEDWRQVAFAFRSSSLPIVSRAPSFFPLPSLPTTQRGLCACRGENFLRLYSAQVVSSLQDYRVSKRFHILPVPQRRQAEFTVKRCCSCQNLRDPISSKGSTSLCPCPLCYQELWGLNCQPILVFLETGSLLFPAVMH